MFYGHFCAHGRLNWASYLQLRVEQLNSGITFDGSDLPSNMSELLDLIDVNPATYIDTGNPLENQDIVYI